jgi:hypothetical protein
MTSLIQYRTGTFTPDTVDMLRKLESRVTTLKARLHVSGREASEMTWESVRKDPGPTGLPPEWSAIPTGREVYLRLDLVEDAEPAASRREREIAMLWGAAIPLGFVPFSRYPLPGPHDDIFHVFGQWSILMDNLLGAGRGEAGWPGFCCAAQIDVETWGGARATERMIQARLHLLGYNVGAIDGILGNKTQGALRAAGLHSTRAADVAQKLSTMVPRSVATLDPPVRGTVDVPGVDFAIHPYGQVRTARTVRGAEISVSGAGRVVIDFMEPPR